MQDPTSAELVRSDDVHSDSSVTVTRATLRNLQELDIVLPLNRFVCITGYSLTGMHSLIYDILYGNLRRLVGRQKRRKIPLHGCRRIEGYESIERVIDIDQAPLRSTNRSCLATHIGISHAVRRLFSGTAAAQQRGLCARHFSLMVNCHPAAPQVLYNGKSIQNVLRMTVDQAVGFFHGHRRICEALGCLQETGLGQLRLGKPASEISGGEAQRIKLARELLDSRAASGRRTLYILEHPTAGLRRFDKFTAPPEWRFMTPDAVDKLTQSLRRLVAAGHSVVVTEKNLRVARAADWVIDTGLNGKDSGVKVRTVYAGPFEKVVTEEGSEIGAYFGYVAPQA
ncbi:MAG: hypothetical protein P8Y71_27665 [Pseudolabrys sp.]